MLRTAHPEMSDLGAAPFSWAQGDGGNDGRGDDDDDADDNPGDDVQPADDRQPPHQPPEAPADLGDALVADDTSINFGDWLWDDIFEEYVTFVKHATQEDVTRCDDDGSNEQTVTMGMVQVKREYQPRTPLHWRTPGHLRKIEGLPPGRVQAILDATGRRYNPAPPVGAEDERPVGAEAERRPVQRPVQRGGGHSRRGRPRGSSHSSRHHPTNAQSESDSAFEDRLIGQMRRMNKIAASDVQSRHTHEQQERDKRERDEQWEREKRERDDCAEQDRRRNEKRRRQIEHVQQLYSWLKEAREATRPEHVIKKIEEQVAKAEGKVLEDESGSEGD
mmetsp:Transcript_8114/g.19814  ORF Transcript_8114/g.19814 Transcript_8114/m.19814 type:complete len:333 (-) Transcript_8114:120-1118(-)